MSSPIPTDDVNRLLISNSIDDTTLPPPPPPPTRSIWGRTWDVITYVPWQICKRTYLVANTIFQAIKITTSFLNPLNLFNPFLAPKKRKRSPSDLSAVTTINRSAKTILTQQPRPKTPSHLVAPPYRLPTMEIREDDIYIDARGGEPDATVQNRKELALPDQQAREIYAVLVAIAEHETGKVFEKSVAPALAGLYTHDKESLSTAQKCVDWITGFIDVQFKADASSTKTMCDKLNIEDPQLNETLNETLKTVIPNYVPGTPWEANLRKQLVEAIITANSPGSQNRSPNEAQLNTFLDWLALENRGQLTSVPKAQPWLKATMSFLIDKQLERSEAIRKKLKEKLAAFAQPGRLADILEKTAVNNCMNIVAPLAQRIAELTASLDFKATFDSILKDVVQAGIQAQMAADAHEQVLREKIGEAERLIPQLKEQILDLLDDIKEAQGAIDTAEEKDKKKHMDAKKRLETELEKVRRAYEQAETDCEKLSEHGDAKSYYANENLAHFAKSQACSPELQDLSARYILLNKPNSDPKSNLQTNERSLFTAMAKRLIPLLLPNQLVKQENNLPAQMDFYEILWGQLEQSPEFQEVYTLLGQLSREISSSKTRALLNTANDETLKNSVKEYARKLIKTVVEELNLEPKITKALEQISRIFLDPNQLDQLLAKTVLPKADEQLFRQMIQKVMQNNSHKVLPMVVAILSEQSSNKQLQIFETILNDWVYTACSCQKSKTYFREHGTKLVQNECTAAKAEEHFRLLAQKAVRRNPNEAVARLLAIINGTQDQDGELSKNALRKDIINWMNAAYNTELNQSFLDAHGNSLIEKEIEALAKGIIEHYNGPNDSQSSPITKNQILNFLSGKAGESNTTFGQLASDLVFKVGKWGASTLIGGTLEESLSHTLTSSLADVRETKDFFARLIIQQLKDYREKMNDPENKTVATHADLTTEIDVTASLAYDMIMVLTSKVSNWGVVNTLAQFGTKMYIAGSLTSSEGPQVSLARLIYSVYSTILHKKDVSLTTTTNTNFVAVQEEEKTTRPTQELTTLNYIIRIGDACLKALEVQSELVRKEKYNALTAANNV